MKAAFCLHCVAALLLALSVAPAARAQAPSLYTGSVPVNSQAEGERDQALKSALAQVVVKLSGGDNAVLARPEVAQAVANAAHYVQMFQYVANPGGGSAYQLVAQFDSAAVDKMIAGLGLAHAAAPGGTEALAAPADADLGTHAYRVWIGGLHSALDYARALGSLSRNELVRRARTELARNDGVEVSMEVIGPLPRMLQSLAGSPLEVLNAQPPIDGVDALLGLRP